MNVVNLIHRLFPNVHVIETSSMGHIPLHANLRKVLFELINIIEPVTSWLNGQRLFFFTSPYCPNYCSDDGMLYLRYNNNTDIFVHCKNMECSKIDSKQK